MSTSLLQATKTLVLASSSELNTSNEAAKSILATSGITKISPKKEPSTANAAYSHSYATSSPGLVLEIELNTKSHIHIPSKMNPSKLEGPKFAKTTILAKRTAKRTAAFCDTSMW